MAQANPMHSILSFLEEDTNMNETQNARKKQEFSTWVHANGSTDGIGGGSWSAHLFGEYIGGGQTSG